jgi:isopenicillin-N N-acyltransferase-like protein
MKKLYLLAIFAVLIVCGNAEACTLFAAAGDGYVKGGGTLISKTRDWTPQYNDVKLYTPNNGNSFYAIVAGDTVKAMTPRAGVNDKGLAMVIASASSVPKNVLRKMPYKGNITQNILSSCSCVDEAVEKIGGYRGQFVILADKKEIAIVEISPEGKTDVKRINSGTLFHTNHYVCDDFVEYNTHIGESSLARYDRIGKLLTDSVKPFTSCDFISFANDRHDGPSNSIWRTGDAKHKTRSQAVFTARIMPDGDTEIYVKICKDPSFPDKSETLKVKGSEIFSSTKK